MQLLKKANNNEGIYIHVLHSNVHTFSYQKFPKNDPLSLDPYNIDEQNQALKLLLVTAIVDLVLYLDL